MQFEDLWSLLRRRPFRPFRITVTTGEEFDVSHPDLAIASRNFISIGMPKLAGISRQLDDFVWVDLNHIVHIQPIDRNDVPY